MSRYIAKRLKDILEDMSKFRQKTKLMLLDANIKNDRCPEPFYNNNIGKEYIFIL